jgi:hypothetical protein
MLSERGPYVIIQTSAPAIRLHWRTCTSHIPGHMSTPTRADKANHARAEQHVVLLLGGGGVAGDCKVGEPALTGPYLQGRGMAQLQGRLRERASAARP